MKSLTNFHLLYAGLLAALFTAVAILWHAMAGSEQQKLYCQTALAVGGISLWVGFVVGQLALQKRKPSVWLQPVSKITGAIISNVFASLLLCMSLVIIGLLISSQSVGIAIFLVAGVLLIGGGLGHYLKKWISSSALLPYALSVFVALFTMMFILIAMK